MSHFLYNFRDKIKSVNDVKYEWSKKVSEWNDGICNKLEVFISYEIK